MEVNMIKEFLICYNFKFKFGVDVDVKFVYLWFLDKCILCFKWGYLNLF